MKLNVYSMFDAAAKAFMRPMFLTTDGQAIRSFQEEANKKDSIVFKYPDQFVLFKIGEFDDNSGELIPMTPQSLGNGVKYKEAVDNTIDAEVVLKELKSLRTEVVYIRSKMEE